MITSIWLCCLKISLFGLLDKYMILYLFGLVDKFMILYLLGLLDKCMVFYWLLEFLI